MSKHLLFVYGTLLSGYGNHRVIKGSKFEGAAITDDKFTMYDNGAYPAIVTDPSYCIHGELYELDDATFRKADALEGYNSESPRHGFYERMEIPVTLVETGKKKTAWIYYLRNVENVKRWDKLNFGDWTIIHPKSY